MSVRHAPPPVRRTPGISCEAPKLATLRQLHPLVRPPRDPPTCFRVDLGLVIRQELDDDGSSQYEDQPGRARQEETPGEPC